MGWISKGRRVWDTRQHARGAYGKDSSPSTSDYKGVMSQRENKEWSQGLQQKPDFRQRGCRHLKMSHLSYTNYSSI